MRVSTVDQHPESQLHDLEQMAQQRSYEIVERYTDRITGTRARRPGLDQMLADARRGSSMLYWFGPAIGWPEAYSHFLEVLDELNRLDSRVHQLRENIEHRGPLGRAVVVIIGAIAELERSLDRRKGPGRHEEGQLFDGHPGWAGRHCTSIVRLFARDRARGYSFGKLARMHFISRTSVIRALQQSQQGGAA